MSPTPTSSAPTFPLDKAAQEFVQEVHARPSVRGAAMAIEINQRYMEYLDSLISGAPKFESDITVQVDGESVKFGSMEAMVNWLAEYMT
jgi:hypothetical protein